MPGSVFIREVSGISLMAWYPLYLLQQAVRPEFICERNLRFSSASLGLGQGKSRCVILRKVNNKF
jgi:hypothetical protein